MMCWSYHVTCDICCADTIMFCSRSACWYYHLLKKMSGWARRPLNAFSASETFFFIREQSSAIMTDKTFVIRQLHLIRGNHVKKRKKEKTPDWRSYSVTTHSVRQHKAEAEARQSLRRIDATSNRVRLTTLFLLRLVHPLSFAEGEFYTNEKRYLSLMVYKQRV